MKTIIMLLLLLSGLASVTGQNDLREDSTMMEFWDETKEEWVLFGRGENTFDVNGQLTTTIGYYADEGNWVPIEKSEYTYDTNGNRILTIEYEDEGGSGEWTISEKQEYFPDAGGKDTLELSYDWDSDAQSWQLQGKSEFSYDAGGNLLMILKYRTEGPGNPWIPKWKFEYLYDSNGNDTLETTYRWDEGNEQWDPSERIAQTFDENGNIILHYHEYWDGNTSQWKFQDKEKYEIVITESTKQETTYDWDESGSKWDPIYRMTYYYSDAGTSSIKHAGIASIRIYPNPATEFIVFDGIEPSGTACIELFDMQGKMVLNQEINNSQKVSVQHLSRGLYLYKYSAVTKTYTGKLIIK